MMLNRILPIISLVLFSLCSFADEIKCNSAGNQLELNACANDEFIKEDKALNKMYQAIIARESGDPHYIKNFKRAQLAWLTFRDAELEANFSCDKDDIRICWGSMYPMSYSYRKAELTRERNKQLEYILKNGRFTY
jgi:uncharacterized protein YecT (DUF1311 family)